MESNPTRMCELLVGLPDVAVLGVDDVAGEPIVVVVESLLDQGWCQVCGAKARVKDRTKVSHVDLPCFGRPTRLMWSKPRWWCPASECPATSWTIVDPRIAWPRAALTDRAARWVTVQVGRHGRSVAEVAAELGCDWHTVNDAVVAYGTTLLAADTDRVGAVDALGLDETLFFREGPRHHKKWCTSIVDAGGPVHPAGFGCVQLEERLAARARDRLHERTLRARRASAGGPSPGRLVAVTTTVLDDADLLVERRVPAATAGRARAEVLRDRGHQLRARHRRIDGRGSKHAFACFELASCGRRAAGVASSQVTSGVSAPRGEICAWVVTSRDPLNAATRSAYGYGSNNPLNRADPSGLWDFCMSGVDEEASRREGHQVCNGFAQVVDNFVPDDLSGPGEIYRQGVNKASFVDPTAALITTGANCYDVGNGVTECDGVSTPLNKTFTMGDYMLNPKTTPLTPDEVIHEKIHANQWGFWGGWGFLVAYGCDWVIHRGNLDCSWFENAADGPKGHYDDSHC